MAPSVVQAVGGQPRISRLGSKEIHGLVCHGTAIQWVAVDSSIESWSCVDPALNPKIPLVADFISRNSRSSWSQRLEAVTEDVAVPATFFEIPSNFKRLNAPQ